MGNKLKTLLGLLVILLIVGLTFWIGSSQRAAQERKNQETARQQQDQQNKAAQNDQDNKDQPNQVTTPAPATTPPAGQNNTESNGNTTTPAPAAGNAPAAGTPATTPAAGPVEDVVIPLAALGFGLYLYRRSRQSLITTVRSR